CERSEAIHRAAKKVWIASSQGLLAMTGIQFRDLAARYARGLQVAPALSKQRAQGRPGARCTRGLMRNVHKECAHEHTGPAESIRPSLRNGFTAYLVLSPENGSFASVAP